jgi:hypothetical protein
VPLIFNSPQRLIYEQARPRIDKQEPLWVIILKARREGVSTQSESLLTTYCALDDGVQALVTAHSKTASARIWSMSKLFVRSSPVLNRIAQIGNNRITFGRSVLEVSTAGSPDAERSADLTAFHGSEVAFWPHPEALLATMQAVPHRRSIFTIVILESTANGRIGKGQLFYDEWLRATAGDSDFLPIFLAWHQDPENRLPGIAIDDADDEERALRERFELSDEQLAWRRWAIRNLCQGDLEKFHQEYPATAEEAFIQSGLPFFRSAELMPLERTIRRGQRGMIDPDGVFHPDPLGHLEVFVEPMPGHRYVVGADSSMGVSGPQRSRSAAQVLDMETLEQCAEYDCISAPHIMARHLAGMGRMYNQAILAPEVQSSGGGGGREMIVYLRDLNYTNLHRKQQVDRIRREPATIYGWETNFQTRKRMLARIREVVTEQSATIHSRKLLSQLGAFGYTDADRTEALSGHDDLLFAWGIALMSRSENFFVAPSAGPVQGMPNWASMGMHVLRSETPQQRLARLLRTVEMKEKSFLEL